MRQLWIAVVSVVVVTAYVMLLGAPLILFAQDPGSRGPRRRP